MPLADDVLLRLFSRGERARLSGSARAIGESFVDPETPYWELPLDERERAHARFQQAASAGAVVLRWGRRGGDDRPLERVRLADLDRLASFLGITTRSQAVQHARDRLVPWVGTYRRLEEVLDAWQALKKVRSMGPETVDAWVDAVRVLEATDAQTEDRLARPLSVALFGRSKRIEELVVHLDVLTAEHLGSPARHWSEVLAGIGVRKEPQPLLVAGVGRLQLAHGPDVPIAVPFVGVANHALTGYCGNPLWVLTVENLTSFHQACEVLRHAGDGLLLFTGGMPSPSWSRAYQCILAGVPVTARVYHWGDHDEGGFRIAAHLSHLCAQAGRRLQPWCMDVTGHPSATPANPSQQRAMTSSAVRAGWLELAVPLPALLLEQEAQAVVLPERDRLVAATKLNDANNSSS